MPMEFISGFDYKMHAGELSSGGLGATIAVGAIYKGFAYMAVFLDQRFCKPLDMFFDGIRDLDDLEIYVAGGTLYTGRKMNEATIRARSYVTKRLNEEGFEGDIKWPDDDISQELVLSPNGHAMCEEIPTYSGSDFGMISNEEFMGSYARQRFNPGLTND